MDLSKKSLIFYAGKRRGKIFFYKKDGVMIDFSKEALRNLDIESREKLSLEIRQILDKVEIKPTTLLIVLDEELYFQDYISEDQSPEEFLACVPYPEVLSKTFSLNGKKMIVAAGKELCSGFKEIFEKEGFKVLGIIPISAAREVAPELRKGFDIKTILKNKGKIRALDLLSQEDDDNKSGRRTFLKMF